MMELWENEEIKMFDITKKEGISMYKDDILRLIEQSPLEIDTEIQVTGRPPTMANSEFLTNKEQGDWAEQVVYKAINKFSNDYFAIQYGRSDSIAAGDDGFADFYIEYQNELNTMASIMVFDSGIERFDSTLKESETKHSNPSQTRLPEYYSKDGRYCSR